MTDSIKSLVWATDIDVLERDRALERRDGYWAVHSPTNPTYWWGNLLLFDEPPGVGDGERWEELFEADYSARSEVTHRTFAWDRTDGEAGEAEREFAERGYELEWTAGLIVPPERIVTHARANRDVMVRALDPGRGRDEDLWEQVIALHLAQAPPGQTTEAYHLTFLRRRQRTQRQLFEAGRGAWYVALLGTEVVGSLGIVVTDSRARYQTVDTAAEHRRRGIATRLVVDAAAHAASHHAIDHFVIAADPDYHALGIYESLGFERKELVVGAMRKPADC
jgi:ribosomal protein S18 acetylase RimI-like enzyme